MKIEVFEMSLPKELNKLNLMVCSEKELRNVLKFCDFSFVLEDITRIQSHILCDLGTGITQSSQRYIKMDSEKIIIPEGLTQEDHDRLLEITKHCYELYSRMTEKKEEYKNAKGRPTKDWYEYGISIEDARYILPLSCNTSMVMTMNGSELLDMYNAMYMYRFTFEDIKIELSKHLPKFLQDALVKHVSSEPDTLTPGLLGSYLKDFNGGETAKLVDINNKPVTFYQNIPAVGAMASSFEGGPTEAMKRFLDPECDWKNPINVTNFSAFKLGHTSLIEHIRFSYLTNISLCAHHQLLRHRLQTRVDMSLGGLTFGQQGFTVPQSIQDSPFEQEFVQIVQEMREFGQGLRYGYGNEYVLYTLLNCDNIMCFTNTNLREFCQTSNNRICLTAQEEINKAYQELYTQLRGVLPESYLQNALPPCMRGSKCKEGAYTCGRPEEVKQVKEYLTN